MASPSSPMVPVPVRRRSLAGPLVLIAIGVFFLLRTAHLIDSAVLHHWFAHWWPLLLILWGVIRLVEYYSDLHSGYPPRRMGGGAVFLLIMVVLIGLGATQADKVDWDKVRQNMEIDDDSDFGNWFGGQTYTFNHTLEHPLPATNGTLRVLSDYGDVTVNSWDNTDVKVSVTKKIHADDNDQASKDDDKTQPTISAEGTTVTVNANTSGAGGNTSVRSDLQLWVPSGVAVDVATRKGDITVHDRSANVKASNSKGDIAVSDVKGDVELEQRSKGDIKVERVSGNVNVTGQVNDSNISDVSGDVKMTGDYYGSMQLSKLAKGFSFRSSRTDLQMAKLDGDLQMDPGDLRASDVTGPVHVLTKATDIHLDGVSGELRVENATSGDVEIHSNRLGTIEITNENGSVNVVLPPKAGFQADLHTHNGDINSDFSGLKTETQNGDSRATGTIGGGGPSVKVSAQHGDVDLRKAGAEDSSGQ